MSTARAYNRLSAMRRNPVAARVDGAASASWQLLRGAAEKGGAVEQRGQAQPRRLLGAWAFMAGVPPVLPRRLRDLPVDHREARPQRAPHARRRGALTGEPGVAYADAVRRLISLGAGSLSEQPQQQVEVTLLGTVPGPARRAERDRKAGPGYVATAPQESSSPGGGRRPALQHAADFVQPTRADARGRALAGVWIDGGEIVQMDRAQQPGLLVQVDRVGALLVTAPVQIPAFGATTRDGTPGTPRTATSRTLPRRLWTSPSGRPWATRRAQRRVWARRDRGRPRARMHGRS